jgi:hypothetical protein
MFECRTVEDQQSEIYARYLEFCNLKWIRIKHTKFCYNYKKNTMRIEAENHDKSDFIDWDRANYPDNPCFLS